MEAPSDATLAAYDGLDGAPVALNVIYASGRAQLSNFRVMDYPIYLEVDLSSGSAEVEPGFRIY